MNNKEALKILYNHEDILGGHDDYWLAYRFIEKQLKKLDQQDGVIKTLRAVIKFEQRLPHIEPNKDYVFDIASAVVMNIQRNIENREQYLLRKWVLETCFPEELKLLKKIRKLYKETHNNVINLVCRSTKEAEKIKELLERKLI